MIESASDILTVTFDRALPADKTVLCVSRPVGDKTIVLKIESGEQADILYRLLTEQTKKGEIKSKGMTKEQRDKILKALAEDRNDYAREIERRIAAEQGKITGADYMIQRFFDVLQTEDSEEMIELKKKGEEKM